MGQALCRFAVLIFVLTVGCSWAWDRSATARGSAPVVVLRLDTSQPGPEFAPGAIGLSTEAQELGTDHLNAARYRLVRLMRLLGPSVLRVGGASVDLSWWTSDGESSPPWATNTVTPADLYALRGLLDATGWRVLLGVDLGHFEPARAADEARHARRILGKKLLGVEIGNEPDEFARKAGLRSSTYGVGEYVGEVETYVRAVSMTAPGVAVYGPALAQTPWLTQLGRTARVFSGLTQHYYPTGTCSGAVPSPQSITSELLSTVVRGREDETLAALARAGAITGRSTRIGETNSVACSANGDASPGFANALWSLDWALRAASSGVAGLNFHSGLGLCAISTDSPICAWGEEAARAGDVTAQPEYYGLLAARQLEGGRFVPVHVTSHEPLPNLTAWATLAPGGAVRVAVDNLATSGSAEDMSIVIRGPGARGVETLMLMGPSISATSGITLGEGAVSDAGGWQPRLTRITDVHSSVRVVVPPASAVILMLRPARQHG